MHQRKLAHRLKDGATYRQHLERAAQAGSPRARRELSEGPALPAACAYVWTWFLELHAARGSNGYGPNPIGFVELEAWARLTGRQPTPWEIAALRALDAAWLTEPKLEEDA